MANTIPTSTLASETAGELITQALRLAHIIPHHQTADDEMIETGLIMMNMILKGWQQDGSTLSRLEEMILPVNAYQGNLSNPAQPDDLVIELAEARWVVGAPVVNTPVVANTVVETVIFDQLFGKTIQYTVEGDVGTVQTTTAHATDNLGYPLTYHFPNDQPVSSFTIDPLTAVITGTIPDPTTNPTLTATITAISNTGCSNTAVFRITPDVETAATGWSFGVFTGAGTGVQPPTSSAPQTQSTPTYLLAGLADVSVVTSGIPAYPFRAYIAKNNQEPFCYFDCNGTTNPLVVSATTQDIEFDEGDFITVSTTPDYATEVNGWVTNSNPTIVTGSLPPDASVGGYVCVNLTVTVNTRLVATGAETPIVENPIAVIPESGPYPSAPANSSAGSARPYRRRETMLIGGC